MEKSPKTLFRVPFWVDLKSLFRVSFWGPYSSMISTFEYKWAPRAINPNPDWAAAGKEGVEKKCTRLWGPELEPGTYCVLGEDQ